MYLEVDETENEKHTLLLVAGGVEAPVGEELKRRDDELAGPGPGPGRRAILVNTDRRSGVLDAAAIVLGNTDRPIFNSLWGIEMMMMNPRKQRRTASPPRVDLICCLSLLVPRLFIPKQMEFGFSLPI